MSSPGQSPVVSATVAESSAIRKLSEAREKILEQLSKVIVGQHQVIAELLICLFARGPCLLDGVPGLAHPPLCRPLPPSAHLPFRRTKTQV